ncbi:MAG: SBBP repeat-containing protein [Candidatus Sulfopaludibacter sp.]|nr:SBBP repeat-containing protein [Candidatus Sulfopaludibacter sp.]
MGSTGQKTCIDSGAGCSENQSETVFEIGMVALTALALAIPLHFEAIRGQTGTVTGFSAVTRRYTLTLSDNEIAMYFRGGAVRMKLPRGRPEGIDELPAKSSYYFGSDPAGWRTAISNFARVRYANVFRGVDLVIHGRDREIEYDWVVAPGADPQSIRFSFEGTSALSIDSGGDLVLRTAGGEIRHSRPRIFQGGHEIAGRFLLHASEVRFEIGAYDKRKALVIDPVLLVNASFGGSGIGFDFPGLHGGASDTGMGIATDSAGNIYVTGTTFSVNFPLVKSLENAPSGSCQFDCGFSSVFVTKLSPDGATLLYSTYIGAPSTVVQEYAIPPLLPASIAADAGGTVYVTGTTSGVNFPGVTTTAGGNDAFLLRLNPQGALVGTKLFGGSGNDAGTSIVLGPDGYIYLAGTTQSPDFPITQGAYREPSSGATNIFIIKIVFTSIFGPTSGAFVYSTVVGPGTSASVAADANGNAYVAAATTSAGWQTTAGVSQPVCAGTTCADIVVAKLDPLGQKLIYATYLGGSKTETLGGIAVDSAGGVYVAGSTDSPDFPTTNGALDSRFNSIASTGFVAKVSTDATRLAYATYLGGSGVDQAMTIAVDAAGNAYVGGTTTSGDFPLRYALQSSIVNHFCPVYTPSGSIPIGEYACGGGGFLAVLDAAGRSLVWSTYLGAGSMNALAIDGAGNVYATGEAIAVNAPSTSGSVGVLKLASGNSGLDVPANPIVNAASFLPGLPLPGGLASLFVRGLNLTGTVIGSGSRLPTELAGVSILVGGVAAPILAVAPVPDSMEQVNFQVPFEAASNTVEIRYQGSSVVAVPQYVAPGIFILSDGTPAIEHAADYSLVTPSNPAHSGEAIIVYATGLGKVTPAGVSGVPASGPASVVPSCGSVAAATSQGLIGSILYAGLAPGYVGLYQVNIQLPQNLAAGTIQFSLDNAVCAGFPFSLRSNLVGLPVD